jgi:hypothetical protein
MFSFNDDEGIPSNCYVALFSGTGIDGWRHDKHGRHVYHVYWHNRKSVWEGDDGAVHLLSVVHANRPRAESLLISR